MFAEPFFYAQIEEPQMIFASSILGRSSVDWLSVPLANHTGVISIVILPYGWIMLAALIAPMGCGIAVIVKRVRRHAPGTCVHCGYDLRASFGRCPECGWAIVEPAAH
jgi:hypothetical protein